MSQRLIGVYRVRGSAASIEARAEALAVEQSVEMPLSAVTDQRVRDEIVGRVETISEVDDELFEVRIALAAATVGDDAGQLYNMLFGNCSLQEDVTLHDVELPAEVATRFAGPRHGIAGLRRRVGVENRAMTASALKPQGLASVDLAALAARLATGGLDYIKDDHGLADQESAPFEARVTAVATALRAVADRTGRRTCYVPSLSGDLDRQCRQVEHALREGVDTALVAPMIAGPSNVQALGRRFPDVALLAHPTMAGAARIEPAALYGRLFRLVGADGVVFPNYGGRFGYAADVCRGLAATARADWHDVRPSLPIPAGGMTPERVPEMLNFYGRDTMLLIGGALLASGRQVTEAAAAFADVVRAHRYADANHG